MEAAGREGVLEVNSVDGIPLLGAFSRSEFSHWTVVIGTPAAELSGSLNRLLLLGTAGLAILLGIGLILAAWQASQIARAVQGLIGPARALGRGEAPNIPPLGVREANDVAQEIVRASQLLHRETQERRSAQEKVQKFNDVLETRVAERTTQLDLANDELENFAAVLVHDLKSPTRTIRQFVQLIEESNGEGRFEKAAEQLHHVSEAAQRIDALIDTLRQYTKAGERVAFTPVEMSVAMTDAMANLHDEIGARSARVTHDALPCVTGSAPQLAQLLQNLIGNGIKYCEAATPTIHVAAEANGGDTWRFTVTDNGIGIAKESYGEVFNAFRRLHGSGKYEGTGLGLATCKKIVERHGGVIGCASEPGHGTTFSFTLPGAGGAA
jgi:signal transduction histidine kinase